MARIPSTPIPYKVKLTGGLQAAQRAINREYQEKFTELILKIERPVRDRLRKAFEDSARNEPEYSSLLGFGSESLRGHFGIRNIKDVDDVLWVFKEMIGIKFGNIYLRKDEIKTSVKIGMFDLREAIQMSVDLGAGVQTTEKGETLPWIEWLLLMGNRIIIQEYDVLFRPNSGRSRQAIMLKEKENGPQKRWKVPSLYQGTLNNNWITRSLKVIVDIADIVIYQEMKKRT